ncbi:MAG: peptidylprolyl isomerase [Ardenticatenaceae bacterium]|nr:peptidylprolyl isomerase [Anaerolineales bacterium]MCB8921598.1 peptidylprolyl isomerase [Ardenticatenaceae bacterium]
MSGDTLKIADNLVVGLDYTLRLEDNEVIDFSDEGDPLEYLHGHGQIIPGLERELVGMGIGDTKKVAVAPTDGYGEYDDDAFELVPHDAFPEDMELEPGMELHMRDSSSGHVIQAFVAEIKPEGVVIDMNHPLAGETLYFEVKVASLRQATTEELAHGHAHGPEGHHH